MSYKAKLAIIKVNHNSMMLHKFVFPCDSNELQSDTNSL